LQRRVFQLENEKTALSYHIHALTIIVGTLVAKTNNLTNEEADKTIKEFIGKYSFDKLNAQNHSLPE
jgi:L-arabinose isomerase